MYEIVMDPKLWTRVIRSIVKERNHVCPRAAASADETPTTAEAAERRKRTKSEKTFAPNACAAFKEKRKKDEERKEETVGGLRLYFKRDKHKSKVTTER